MSAHTIRSESPLSQEAAIADFLKQLSSLRSKKTPVAKPWTNSFATMPDDEASQEAARLGAEWRAAMNDTSHG